MNPLFKYILGFGLSLLLTLGAAGLMWAHIMSGHVSPTHETLTAAFVMLALLQLLVQLVFFLHVGQDRTSDWHTAALSLTLFIVCILVGGTLWIMNNVPHAVPQEFLNGVVVPQNQLD